MTSRTYLPAACLLATLSVLPASLFSADALVAPPAPSVAQPESPPLSFADALKVFHTPPGVALDRASGSSRDWDAAQANLGNLESYLENNDFTNAANQARQYARQTRSPEIKKLWENLIEAMKAEQKKREADMAASLDAELKKAATTLLAASKSADVDPIIDKLQTLQDSLGNNYTVRTQRPRNRLSNAISFCTQWQDLLSMLETGDTDGARNQLRNLSSGSSRDHLFSRSEILARSIELKIGQADIAAESARLDDIVKRTNAVALSATKADQLDPFMEELYSMRDSRNGGYDNRLQRVYNRVDGAINFYQQWQNMLGALEAGDPAEARNQLRNLSSSGYNYRPIGRSEILARIAALPAPDEAADTEILKGATLDNLADYRSRVVAAQESANGRRSSEYYNAIGELDGLIAATTALKDGRAGDGRGALKEGASTCGASNGGPLQPALDALRSQWFALALPALTGLKDLPAYKDGENTLAYVRRQFDAAAETGDWARAHRFALVEKDMMPASSPCAVRETVTGANPVASIGAWLDGQLMEKASQPEAAAELYRTALKDGAPPKLEEQIIARLKALATEVPGSTKIAG